MADVPADPAAVGNHPPLTVEPELSPELLRQVATHAARFGTPALAAIARHYLATRPPRPACPSPHAADGLTEREAEVLKRIARGSSNKEIASQMLVSMKTVETYKARAMKKLGIRRRVDVVRYAIRQGWLSDSETGG
jgi:DNA-binding NarL/FixJ family response regulator